MVLKMYCSDYSEFRISYSGWDKFRGEIMQATFHYLDDKIEKDKQTFGMITDEDDNEYIGKGSEYYIYMTEIQEFKILLNKKNNKNHGYLNDMFDDIYELKKNCNNNKYLMNALNYFKVGGLYSLCDQSYCEGCYTCGNSLDICGLLDLIEPFVKKYDCYERIYDKKKHNTLYELFEASYKYRENVTLA